MIANSIEELIGNTPLIKINSLSNESGATILGKCEFLNPTSSVKDRIALNMVNKALESKEIDENTTLIEPTSGNTGIGLASICASKGIKLILVMPESMSIERRKLLTFLGAKLELTPAPLGMKGAIEKAKELESSIENSKILQQFENPNNSDIHRTTTALEILNSTNGNIDFFVAGVGTGGTITGVSEVLKEKNPKLISIAVEPKSSQVLAGESPSPHKIQGIGAGFVPKILNTSIYNGIFPVSNEDAFKMAQKVAKEDGLLVGISAGANLYASYQIAKENKNRTVVTILCDTAESYLSTDLFKD